MKYAVPLMILMGVGLQREVACGAPGDAKPPADARTPTGANAPAENGQSELDELNTAADAAKNIFVGKSAGEKAAPDAAFNTVVGNNAGMYLTSNRLNTFLGFRSGSYCRSDNNTCLGALTGTKLGLGENNTFVGRAAGAHVTSGSHNTLIGDRAAGILGTGNDNVMIGAGAGNQTRTASANVFIGKDAGMYNTQGTGNVFLGNLAGQRETGDNKLFIANSGVADPLIYGEFDHALVGINGNLGVHTRTPKSELDVVHADKSDTAGLRIENAAANGEHWRLFADKASGDLLIFSGGRGLTAPVARIDSRSGEYRTASDARIKSEVVDLGPVLPRVMRLSPKTYHTAGETSDERRHIGLIASDVEVLFPEAVSAADASVIRHLNYSAIAVLALQAVREQQSQIDTLREQNTALARRLDQLEARSAPSSR